LVLKAKKPKHSDYPLALNTIGDRLRARRLDLGLLQKELATILGVTEDTVSYRENNRVKPSRRLMDNVWKFLGLSLKG
jgi:transcriptional regulator with XRE-family HTH domain